MAIGNRWHRLFHNGGRTRQSVVPDAAGWWRKRTGKQECAVIRSSVRACERANANGEYSYIFIAYVPVFGLTRIP